MTEVTCVRADTGAAERPLAAVSSDLRLAAVFKQSANDRPERQMQTADGGVEICKQTGKIIKIAFNNTNLHFSRISCERV